MIEADRLIAATGPRDREEVQDRAIRPLSLAEYIGQPTVREQMPRTQTSTRPPAAVAR